MFLELAPGGDLLSFVSAHGGFLEELHTRVIMRQVVLAVQYMHSVGVTHRDLKPENILVMHTEVGQRIVVTDFGCASYNSNGRHVARMTSLVGTNDYLAP
jgi:serine/threonine protein kinase